MPITIESLKNSFSIIFRNPMTLISKEFIHDFIKNRSKDKYFSSELLRLIVEQPLMLVDALKSFDFKVNIHGGGMKGQAEALRLAVARALVKNDDEIRK